MLNVTTSYLADKGIENPRLTAEVLLAHQLHMDRMNLYLTLDRPLNEFEVSGYRNLIRRRVQKEPLQYITGCQEFWSLDFAVDPRVLIPRPETEILVEQVLHRIKKSPDLDCKAFRILDIGTGTGILAIVLAKEVQGAEIWATDISPPAIVLAKKNAEKHGVTDRIQFLTGNLLEPLRHRRIAFDFIVANPPYISNQEYGHLAPEVRVHEPKNALDGGKDGMDYIRRIIKESVGFLKTDGWLMLEISPRQMPSARALIQNTHGYCETAAVRDYSSHYRVLCARYHLKGRQ